jgi:hypothetical protein
MQIRYGLLLLVAMISMTTFADEGMWLYNALPLEAMKRNHNFTPPEGWAERLQLSSVRFNSGGSGSFVSSKGLVLTNHHVASDTLQKLSSAERNLLENGFLARTPTEELKSPDLELNQLVDITDVTARVNEAVKPGSSAEEAFRARRAIMADLEKKSLEDTGLRSDVVTLFGGAQYHLYRYKKYTDVRLVWAPETKTAFFGGDADNFEYPRYCLDVTLFRVYENNQPVTLTNYLPLASKPLVEGDLVFVSGHPGRTQRGFTVDALKFLRDDRLPYVMKLLQRKEVLYQQYGLAGPEHARRARDELFSVQNSRKAYSGMIRGLQDPAFFATKRAQEENLLTAIQSNPKTAPLAQAWADLSRLQEEKRKILATVDGFRCHPFELARTLVDLAAEDKKPSTERLREYRDSNRESLLQELLSTAPIYDDLEKLKLEDELGRLAEARGGDDPLVLQVLAGKGPEARAFELIEGSKVAAVDYRKSLVEGGSAAIEKAKDPLLELARIMDSEYRRVRELREKIEEQERQAYAKVTEATVAVKGTGNYPDATFTLRLAMGVVRGYSDAGKRVAPWTTLGEAFEYAKEHAGQTDYALPESWLAAQGKIDGSIPFNFVSTADIIGGNSGSPTVNRQGELVGIIFDGNIQSLTSDYMYSDIQGRSVSVAAPAMIETLRKVYDAAFLADEIGR